MADDNCSDCGLADHLHIREDGVYGCPADTSISSPLCERCSLPARSHVAPHCATITCPGRCVSALQDTLSESADSATRSGPPSPDPLLLAPDKQLPEQRYRTLRRSAQYEDVVMPLRRSARQENQWRARDAAERHAQAPARRSSSHRMAGGPSRTSRGRRTSLQDVRRSSRRSYENEVVSPAQNLPPRRKSLPLHVLGRMVPVEDMEPFEGFRPFTELDPGQLPDPVTIRQPVMDFTLTTPPFEYAWNPSVVIPAVGGMRVRVGQFERGGRPAGYTTPFTCSATAESEASSSSSCSEGYFSAQDWSSSSALEHRPSDHGMPSIDTAAFPLPSLPGPSQPEFIQGSSTSIPPLQSQTLAGNPRDTNSPSMEIEFPQLEALTRHYAAVQGQARGIDPLQQLTSSPCHAMGPMPSTFASASHPSQHPESAGTPCLRQISSDVAPLRDAFTTPPTAPAPQPIAIKRLHTLAKSRPRGSTTMPCTFQSKSSPSIPSRGSPEVTVDDVEDWATREPWEYIHRVLTSSTCPLVMFLKTPTGDIPTAAMGALGADLRLQKMLVDNEHWLLIGPRDIDLLEFGVKFQNRAHTRDKFAFRFGDLNWGADVNQIEDEVQKAAARNLTGGVPAELPTQFMAGAVGGLVVWYALSLM